MKALLARHGIAWANDHQAKDEVFSIREEAPRTETQPAGLSASDKVALFRRLFQGRQDVFARRWESSQGKSGYSPACENEWVDGICRKPSVKCADCRQRKLLSLTDQVIFDQLTGKLVIGLYPLLNDDTVGSLPLISTKAIGRTMHPPLPRYAGSFRFPPLSRYPVPVKAPMYGSSLLRLFPPSRLDDWAPP